MTKGEARRQWIVDFLNENETIGIGDIVGSFHVSEVTARRDLELLENEKRCIRTIGGAVVESAKTGMPFFDKLDLQTDAKKEIAEKAIGLIRDGDIIALTGGTTTYYIAKKLRHFKRLTVVTNAVNIAFELIGIPGLQLILTGGVIRSQNFELCGPLADMTLQQISIQKTFVGADGVSLERGIMTFDESEARTNRTMMHQSMESYLVADHTKFDKSSLFLIEELSALSGIITDSGLPDDVRNRYPIQQLD